MSSAATLRRTHPLWVLPELTVDHEVGERIDTVHDNEAYKPSAIILSGSAPPNMSLSIP